MNHHLIPRLTIGEAGTLIEKHGKKGDGMRLFALLGEADEILHAKGVEISKIHAVVEIAYIERLRASLRQTRISQLRRMTHTAWLRAGHPLNANFRRKRSQYDRFAAACLAEIERLRGMG